VLAVPDRAVAATAVAWATVLDPATLVVHTAGALDLAPLEPARKAGLRVGSLHPLRAIASARTPLEGTWAAIDGDPATRRRLARLARDAGMRPLPGPRDRVRYHLGAVLAANSQAPLLEAAVAELVRAGVAEQAARAALAALARGAIDAWAERGGPEGLTGPIARGDAATVRAHLERLPAASPTRALYRALGQAALELAGRRRPAPEGLRAVSKLLRKR
jgi:predicted short-subunit dehydrogenase-like oxidoreductase (DUF2520 family)